MTHHMALHCSVIKNAHWLVSITIVIVGHSQLVPLLVFIFEHEGVRRVGKVVCLGHHPLCAIL